MSFGKCFSVVRILTVKNAAEAYRKISVDAGLSVFEMNGDESWEDEEHIGSPESRNRIGPLTNHLLIMMEKIFWINVVYIRFYNKLSPP
uniref:Uncharacterized protein n=1 Tax=Caenorhabditis japonica TaxID=281687 RepID=A0A8R1I8A5_CAEJA